MNRVLRSKVASLTLVFAMLFSVSSCKMKSASKEHRKIHSEDPWFDAKVIHIDPEVDIGGKELVYKDESLLGIDDSNIVVLSRVFFTSEDAAENNMGCFVTVVDHDSCEAIHTTDLNQFVPEHGFIDNIVYMYGRITATVSDWQEGTCVDIDIDGRTGEKLEEREHNVDQNPLGNNSLFRVGKYSILATTMFDDNRHEFYQVLDIYSFEGEKYHAEIRKEHMELVSIPAILPLDGEKILVPATENETNIPIFFEVDIRKEEVTEVDGKNYEWIDFGRISNSFSGNDGQVYFSTSDGISRIDLPNKKIEKYFDFDACLLNHYHLGNSEMIDCSDGRILFLGEKMSYFSLGDPIKPGFDLYVLSKTSENPHAGKTVLELYAANGYVDRTVSEAIVRYNSTNKEFFIEVTDEYLIDSVIYTRSSDTIDDEKNEAMKRNLSLNDMIAMNLVSGTGPDILIITDEMGRLNNSNYLLDLNRYFGELNSDTYFTNIIDAAKIDGKLYQLPLAFRIEGIHTDTKYAGNTGIGFTTSEYEEFLYGPLNGYDIIENGQARYFVTLFNAMREKFIVNGKVDLSVPEFSILAEYVKTNVSVEARPYRTDASEDPTQDMRDYVDGIARLSVYGFPLSYLEGVRDLNGARSILGIPSADGRGPLVSSACSVAVSSRAKNTDACVDFIKTLLSDDLLYDMAKTQGFTISREAYHKTEEATLDHINGPQGYEPASSSGMSSRHSIRFTEKDMTELENILLSCSHFDSSDSSIDMILIEEMPAYFFGQKDLDAVISILQDRIQTVLNERA